MATASSGLTPLPGGLLKYFSTIYYTFGILVIPPTNNTSPTLSFVIPASLIQLSQGFIVFLRNSSTSPSNLALVITRLQCLGPLESAVK